MHIFLAYSVHLFTASGIVFGFLAMTATVQDQKFTAFLMLGIALIIDGIDGALARAAKVKTILPHMDGTTLDNVIDYVTYVAIPALMVWHWGLVPEGWGLGTGAAMMLASCYTYANANMKTKDAYFVGFPAIWNCVVLYLLIFSAGPIISLAVLIVCFVLSFVPTAYIHPLRVKTLLPVSLIMTLIWAVSSSLLIWEVLARGHSIWDRPVWAGLLTISTLYFGAISLWRSFKNPNNA